MHICFLLEAFHCVMQLILIFTTVEQAGKLSVLGKKEEKNREYKKQNRGYNLQLKTPEKVISKLGLNTNSAVATNGKCCCPQ